MDCIQVLRALEDWRTCFMADGRVVVTTDCLYPSFEQVRVVVESTGTTFVVSDDGGALSCVLSHGKTGSALPHALSKVAKRQALIVNGLVLQVRVESIEWIAAAILAVANASSSAAFSALEAEEVTEREVLLASIDQEITEASQEVIDLQKEFIVRRDFTTLGRSGKAWRFDFAIMSRKKILIKTVSPHGNSVNANFVAFSDIKGFDDNISYCVYAREPSESDVRLLNQVASVVPVSILHDRIRREVHLLH